MLRRSLLALLSLACTQAAMAETGPYPNKPIKLVIPFAPGGGSDVVGRLVADRLALKFKQPVLIVNAPGAGGQIATQQVASAPADGYTLLYANASTLTMSPHLVRKRPPEPWTVFVPVTPVAEFFNVLVANPRLQANTLQELVQQAKANPDKISFGSPGMGTTSHLLGEMMMQDSDIRMVHVTYRGAGAAITDLLGGQVDFLFEQPATILQFLASGKLKAVAVASAKRAPALPNVPTVGEAGMPGLALQSWTGVVAPIGTDKLIVELLQREIAAVLEMPDVREALAAKGYEPMKGGARELGQLIRKDYARWGALIKSRNIVLD